MYSWVCVGGIVCFSLYLRAAKVFLLQRCPERAVRIPHNQQLVPVAAFCPQVAPLLAATAPKKEHGAIAACDDMLCEIEIRKF